jgi:chromosome segregation ATPase
LDSANALLAAKSAELAKSGAVRANVEESLRAEITRLNNEMRSRTAALQSREDELDRVRAEMTSVVNRIVQLNRSGAHQSEVVRSARRKYSGAIASLRDDSNKVRCRNATTAPSDLADAIAAKLNNLANLSSIKGRETRREVDWAQGRSPYCTVGSKVCKPQCNRPNAALKAEPNNCAKNIKRGSMRSAAS